MGKNQDPGSGINIPDPQHWLYLLSQFLYSLSHHSLQATQSFTKVSKRWRCICSRNSSTASPTTPYMQHNPLRKSQKKMALHQFTQCLYCFSHHSLLATNNPLRKSQKDGTVTAHAIPLQRLSPLPICKQHNPLRK
jgi:hypothetical protein